MRNVGSARVRAPTLAAATVVALLGAPVVWPQANDEAAGPAAQKPPQALFEDRAEALGVDFTHRNGMTGELYFAEMVGSGVALFDADGDGDLDLDLVDGGPLAPGPDGVAQPSDRLYRNDLGSGTARQRFVDVSARSGLGAVRAYGMGVTAGDIDNDGRIDLYVTNLGSNHLWRNVSTADALRFEAVENVGGADDPRWSVPAVFFDYDADGWLDLFVGNYVDFRLATHKTCFGRGGAADYCGPSAYRSETDRLLRNLGAAADSGARFEDVTVAVGLREAGAALGAVSDDFDGDGLADLYVANDGMANRLYLQRRAEDGAIRFVDEALLAGTAVNDAGLPEASMGVLAGDFDADGSPDLFMTHLDGETNTLYLNDGAGLFRDHSRQSGLGGASWSFTGFGTVLLDADVDGEPDLFVANGAVTLIEAQRTAGDPHPLKQTNLFFRGLGGGRFTPAPAVFGPALAVAGVWRGVAVGDLENDGDPDLVVTSNGGAVQVLVNRADPAASAWLGLRLLTADGRRDALGARVGIERHGAPTLWRRSRADGSYASSNDPRVLVGLGGPPVTGVRVDWPSGRSERFAAPAPGRYHTLREGTGEADPGEAP